jgi:hypothetical protein
MAQAWEDHLFSLWFPLIPLPIKEATSNDWLIESIQIKVSINSTSYKGSDSYLNGLPKLKDLERFH